MNPIQEFAVDFIVFALLSAILIYGMMQLAFPPIDDDYEEVNSDG